MSYSNSAVQLLLAALDNVDNRLDSLTPADVQCLRATVASVKRSSQRLTVADARGRHARIVMLVREGRRDEARLDADALHRDALHEIDRLPLGCAEAIELAGLALKSVETL